VREVRRYSDKTIALAARHVHRALPHIVSSTLSKRDRVDLFVTYCVRQGLQPSDLARPSGADACVAMATVLRSPNWIDTERIYTPYAPLVIDSFNGPFDVKSPPLRQVPRKPAKAGSALARLDYSDLETRIAARIAAMPQPVTLSASWKRVVARVMRMPGKI